jgi:hypothetical protein
MDAAVSQLPSWFLASVLALVMIAGWAIGWTIGRKNPADPEDKSAARFIDGSLALLGLLLGFTFAMALSKYEQRRTLVIADANSIADFYTCASLVPDPPRSPLQQTIREYLDIRLQLSRNSLDLASIDQDLRNSDALQQRMTDLASVAVNANSPIAVPLVNTLNEVTSSHASLIAAMRDRLPYAVLFLLAATAVVSTILVSRHHGLNNRLNITGTLCYILLVSLAIYVILDLNQPRAGLIKVDTSPLERLAACLAK